LNYQFDECLNYDNWDNFVVNSPQSNVFCSTNYLNARHHSFKLYFVRKNGNIMLGCVLILDKNGNACVSPSMYQGILFDNYISTIPIHRSVKITLETIEFLFFNLVKKYINLKFSMHYSINDIRAFQWFNYHETDKAKFLIKPRYTGILKLNNINNFESLIRQARKVRGQEYKKCIKEGFTVSISNNVEILDNLHHLTFERQGLKRTDGEKFLAFNFSKIAIEKGFGRLMICKNKEGEPVSASIFLIDKIRGYYLIGATNPEYRKYGVGSFTVFHQIKKCFDDGLNEIDFIGINSPNRGDFKTSFNAEPRMYFEMTYK
jgi:lipid II:glycine glycyltransferase (peptidoglycan interpeptide bridge formation enzyme)